jgi:hypothetical protein
MDILYSIKVPQHLQKAVNPVSSEDRAGQPAEFLLEPFLIAAGRDPARVRIGTGHSYRAPTASERSHKGTEDWLHSPKIFQVDVTVDAMSVRHLSPGRGLLFAYRADLAWAARMEPAARRRIEGAGDRA